MVYLVLYHLCRKPTILPMLWLKITIKIINLYLIISYARSDTI